MFHVPKHQNLPVSRLQESQPMAHPVSINETICLAAASLL